MEDGANKFNEKEMVKNYAITKQASQDTQEWWLVIVEAIALSL